MAAFATACTFDEHHMLTRQAKTSFISEAQMKLASGGIKILPCQHGSIAAQLVTCQS
jgi:hypothetical protein